MMTNADTFDMQCVDEAHVQGCPCQAGGDVEVRYVSYGPCYICKRDTDSTSVNVDFGAPRGIHAVCDRCYSRADEFAYLDERLDMTDAD